MTTQEILSLSVLSAAVGAAASVITTIIKDYWFSRSFELWKQRQALDVLYQRFRDPLLLTTRELASRVSEIIGHYPPNYFASHVASLRPPRQLKNNIEDEYFQRYKLVSTIYRACAFFGWLELYRQEITFLQSRSNELTSKLDQAIADIRTDWADGHLNDDDDWEKWEDTLVFREELRAIGEAMIEPRGASRAVMGYGKFCQLFEGAEDSSTRRWAMVVANFFVGQGSTDLDFRKVRLQRLLVHLAVLVEFLGGKPRDEAIDYLGGRGLDGNLGAVCRKWNNRF